MVDLVGWSTWAFWKELWWKAELMRRREGENGLLVLGLGPEARWREDEKDLVVLGHGQEARWREDEKDVLLLGLGQEERWQEDEKAWRSSYLRPWLEARCERTRMQEECLCHGPSFWCEMARWREHKTCLLILGSLVRGREDEMTRRLGGSSRLGPWSRGVMAKGQGGEKSLPMLGLHPDGRWREDDKERRVFSSLVFFDRRLLSYVRLSF